MVSKITSLTYHDGKFDPKMLRVAEFVCLVYLQSGFCQEQGTSAR